MSKRQPKNQVVVSWASCHFCTAPYWSIDGNLNYHDHKKRKIDAIRVGKKIARADKAELIVKNKDGKIGYRNSYGRDAKHRPG